MTRKKTYFKHLDILRIIFCIAVLLYHLKLLKGGYLAVCCFFTLSGYLSCVSAFRKEEFSLKQYYLSRLLKIYLPLALVVFITIPFIFFMKDIILITLKPEVKSVLLGYNNFWQLNANLDYFARHIDSPFMHLWYVSILLQFELIFPIIYIPLKKLGDKNHKVLPILIAFALGVASSIFFYISGKNQGMMVSYYNTFSRSFSLFFGLALGFTHSYFKPSQPKGVSEKPMCYILFYTYLLALIGLFVFVDATSVWYPASMIASTIITCRLIYFGVLLANNKKSFDEKIIKSLSGISYEVYLLQYPIIFLFQYISISEGLKIPVMLLILISLSYLIHSCLNIRKNEDSKFKVIKYILCVVLVVFSIFGFFKYITAENHEAEMKDLENQLAQNELVVKQKQEEYERKLKQEQEEIEKMLEDIEKSETELHDIVKKLPVVAVGDSVLLGASPKLYETFSNAYVDAKVSRTAWVLDDILKDLKSKGTLGNPIVINLGANGDCSNDEKRKIIETCGNKQIFWITVTNDKKVHVNDDLVKFSEEFENFHVIDWCTISNGHKEYFVADGIHLTNTGCKAYVKAIYDAIYAEYSKEFTKKKEELLLKQQSYTNKN